MNSISLRVDGCTYPANPSNADIAQALRRLGRDGQHWMEMRHPNGATLRADALDRDRTVSWRYPTQSLSRWIVRSVDPGVLAAIVQAFKEGEPKLDEVAWQLAPGIPTAEIPDEAAS